MRIDINGVIIPNDDKWLYDYLEMDSTCINDVQRKLDFACDDEDVDVYINSPGGEIASGSAIYTALKSYTRGHVKIHITGQAHSAASIIAMAGWCEMSPTALMMVHCVSTCAAGNHGDMEKTAETLREADKALSSAYILKSGMSRDEALAMMEKETWLRAEEALKLGLIDKVMFEDDNNMPMVASSGNYFKVTEKLASLAKRESSFINTSLLKTENNNDKDRLRLAKAKLDLQAEIGGKI